MLFLKYDEMQFSTMVFQCSVILSIVSDFTVSPFFTESLVFMRTKGPLFAYLITIISQVKNYYLRSL